MTTATVQDGYTLVRQELSGLLGNPDEWMKELLFVEGKVIPLYCCPHCGAACLNPYQHKAWHLQNCI